MALPLHPIARACGKVILLGEHAVVYGYPALAAGLPGSLQLSASPLHDALAPIRLSIPAWGLEEILRPDNEHPVARACLEVLSYCDGPVTGWAIEGQTSLPARAGLGSSAALSVAIARLALGNEADPEVVVEASMAGERIFHGQPSGIDSEVATRGGLVRYVKGKPVEAIPLRGELPLLIVPSSVPRSTADQVARVRAGYDRLPKLFRPLLDLCASCVAAGVDAISENDLDTLGEIMTVAHHVLGGLGVSSPILDELCSVARENGARGAKLTGAGGGGCILVLPPDSPATLLDAFEDRGYAPLLVQL